MVAYGDETIKCWKMELEIIETLNVNGINIRTVGQEYFVALGREESRLPNGQGTNKTNNK